MTGQAAVVGLGAVTAFGWSHQDLRRGLNSGETAVAEPRLFSVGGHRTRLVSEVPQAEANTPLAARFAGTDYDQLSSADRFAVVAAVEAWQQTFADVQELDLGTVGVFFGGSTAGMAEAESFFAETLNVQPGPAKLRQLNSQQLNGPGDAVARVLGIGGPVVSFSSACASGALALGAALDALRSGEVEVAIAGGSDSLCQMTYAGFNALRAVDPELSRPFRADRAGLNLGEGAGVVVLANERWEGFLAERGRRPLARLSGAGASCDAYHMTAPHPDGEGAAGAMAAALLNANEVPESVGFVNTHGTGTPHNDSAEAAAIRKVLGESPSPTPITSVKGAIGHLLGSAGAVEAVATVLALMEGSVQPTTGSELADEDFEVDLVVGESRLIDSTRAKGLSNSFAFGGANASLLFSATGSAVGDDT